MLAFAKRNSIWEAYWGSSGCDEAHLQSWGTAFQPLAEHGESLADLTGSLAGLGGAGQDDMGEVLAGALADLLVEELAFLILQSEPKDARTPFGRYSIRL